MSLYSISDLANEFGVTYRALRFYESKGLLDPVRKGTQRIYAERHRARVGEILAAKAFGLTIPQIRDRLTGDGILLSEVEIKKLIARREADLADITGALQVLRSRLPVAS